MIQKVIGAGFSHSCAINSEGLLYVWGDNSNQQLMDTGLDQHKTNSLEPTNIRLIYGRENSLQKASVSFVSLRKNLQHQRINDYKAFDLACGPYNTWVLARKNQHTFINYDDTEGKKILAHLRKVLLAEGTLARYFQLYRCGKNRRGKKSSGAPIANSESDQGGYASEGSDCVDQEQEQEKLHAITAQDPFMVEVTLEEFTNQLYEDVCRDKQLIKSLFKQIYEMRLQRQELGSQDCLILGDIEDFALQYQQQNTQLFMFGYASRAQRNFEQEIEHKRMVMSDSMNRPSTISADEDDDDVKVVSRPTAIKFPKFTKPLASVSCGQGHVLVLSIDNQMYSWGDGSYGALGFNSKDNVYAPTKLNIYDQQGSLILIAQISCGKFHSMCLTTRQGLWTWGQGNSGKLGHDDPQCGDHLKPKKLIQFSQKKPMQISAGESHSAAVTETKQLYTWGHGGFGRLGHGDDNRQLSPRLVDSLTAQEIVQVSCGQFHTLAASKQGVVFSFGQNKYGKLGINNAVNHIGSYMAPNKIHMFKSVEPLTKEKTEILQVCAGFNHSLALSQAGKVYSWGYSGKNILGRTRDMNSLALPVGLKLECDQKFKMEQASEFLKLSLRDAEMLFGKGHQAFNGDNKNEDVQQQNENNMVPDNTERPMETDNSQDARQETIKQVCCGSVNTLTLTTQGRVQVLGDNSYGQHGKEDLDIEDTDTPRQNDDDDEEDERRSNYGNYTRASSVQFELTPKDKILYIACGGEHMFARSSLDKVFGWGRSDEGQLGVGLITEKIDRPMLVKDLSFQGIKQISCGENYSAALTKYGAVYVTGSLSGGKLGLGKGLRRGYQLTFRVIPRSDLPEVQYIACGLHHMLAITKFNDQDQQSSQINTGNGKTFAWGRNSRGQLGIGNKENQYSPHVVQNVKERLRKVVCGHNYSLGLSYQNQVYFWGNFKYSCDQKLKKDLEEPVQMLELGPSEIIDIECCYKKCFLLQKKGTLRQWGKFLASKQYDESETKEKKEKKAYLPYNFPRNPRFNICFQSLVVGPNHACGFPTNQNKIYVWGHNNLQNRMGLAYKDQEERALELPIILPAIEDYFERRDQELNQQMSASDESESVKDEINVANNDFEKNEEEKVSELGETSDGGNSQEVKVSLKFSDTESEENEQQKLKQTSRQLNQVHKRRCIFDDIQEQEAKATAWAKSKNKVNMASCIQELINSFVIAEQHSDGKKPPGSQGKKLNVQQLKIFDYKTDMALLDRIRQELVKRKEAPLLQITSKGAKNQITSSNFALYRILKHEEEQFYDEKAIATMEKEIHDETMKIMRMVYGFSKVQVENQDILDRIRNNFNNRIVDTPFAIDLDKQQELCNTKHSVQMNKQQKELIKQVLLYLQLQPCYLIKLFKSDLIGVEAKKRIIDQLFSSQSRFNSQRMNYLLLSIFKQLFPFELKKLQAMQEEQKQQHDEGDGCSPIVPFIFDKHCKLISYHIFRKIFDSQMTNNDTVCCVAAHVVSKILMEFVNSNGLVDHSIDVTDFSRVVFQENEVEDTSGNTKEAKITSNKEEKKIEKPAMKRAQDLANFIRQILEDVLNNNMFKGQTQFGYRKRMREQVDVINREYKKIYCAENHKRKIEDDEDINDAQLARMFRADQKTMLGAESFNPAEVAQNVPSLRFSEEVLYMLRMIYEVLEAHPCFKKQEEQISNQILGLIFNTKLTEIQDNLFVNLVPYLQKSNVGFTKNYVNEIHPKNIRSALTILNYVILGKDPFAQDTNPAYEKAIERLNKELMPVHGIKTEIVNKIMRYGCSSCQLLLYKNFEYQVLHCLEQEATTVHMSTKLVGKLLKVLQDNLLQSQNQSMGGLGRRGELSLLPMIDESASEHWAQLSLMNPAQNDPMYQLMRQLASDSNAALIREMSEVQGYQETTKFKLPTQLLIFMDYKEGQKLEQQTTERLSHFVRCLNCDAILTKEIAVQNFDKNLLLSEYQPEDKQSLMFKYCSVLKNIEGRSKDDKLMKATNMTEFFEIAVKQAKAQQNYLLDGQIQEFEKKLQVLVDNMQDKRVYRMQKVDDMYNEMLEWYPKKKKLMENPNLDRRLHALMVEQNVKDTDEAMRLIVKEAEAKVNERILQKFNLTLIHEHIQWHLMPQIGSRIEICKSQQISQNKKIQQNNLFGMANKKLLCLAQEKQYKEKLIDFVEIHNYQNVQRRSSGLQAALKKMQQNTVRGYLALPAQALLLDGTIIEVRLKPLKPLIPKCEIILIESDDLQKIEFKLVYKERKKQLCGPDLVVQEQILLQFHISVKKMSELKSKRRAESSSGKGNEGPKQLVFEECDGLIFDHAKFVALFTQMEKQRNVYNLQ